MSIEGNPFIIRFKTEIKPFQLHLSYRIEGNPFIIRFKTHTNFLSPEKNSFSIEGNPFIIRFKSKIAIKNIIKFLHIFIKRLKFHHF